MNNEDRNLIAKQHCNKLIAEFMGLSNHLVNGGVTKITIDGVVHEQDWECFDTEREVLITPIEMQYHASWDCLMPVVSKCFKTGDDTHQWDNIMDAMFTCDISIVYAQVVEFIKQYNDEQ